MADYAKRKNEELIALCKERGLPHTGKKADFVKRLEEYDSQQGAAPESAAPAAKPAIEDEIDWDDEPAAATTEPAAAAIAAGGEGPVANPIAVPNQVQVEDPAQAHDGVMVPVNGDVEAGKDDPPAKDYSVGISARTIEEEIEKRKARARRFGLPEDSDEIKILERAKRFGVTDASNVPGLLNSALSEGRAGGEKKRGLDSALSEDAGVRKRGRGGKMGGRGGWRRERSRTPRQESKPVQASGNGSWMSAEDRAKAEARKARFAAPGAA